MEQDAINFSYLLLNDYKKLLLEEKEVVTLLLLDQLLRQGNTLVTADLLALKMSIKQHEIDEILVSLLRKGMIEYVPSDDGSLRTSIAPAKRRLYDLLQQGLAKANSELMGEKKAEELSTLYSFFERRLNRTLSPLESDTISSWLDDSYSVSDIKNALEDAINANKRSIKSIEKILRKGKRRDDIAKEGYSGISETWNEDIEKTLEIARRKWVDGE